MNYFAERYRLKISWVVGIASLFIVFFTKSRYQEGGLYDLFKVLGYSLIIIATLGRIWASIYICGRKDEEVCQDGPYSIIRNPLYVFSFIGAVGVILGSKILILFLIVMPLFIFNYYFVICSEERRLLQMFGDKFAAYCAKVERITPNFNNYWTQEKLQIEPKVIVRSMLHASFFMWIIVALEILEYLKGAGVNDQGLIPTLWVLPF
ncbi:MAG: hypothetical protein A2511_01725 [Deltaproteobacteria bacterium RIFOXYD12_FULL_50_9]|nr:MAG: hypothetical protein A2511_01725 [Deltaproteobacteria bacterium RIFOXYD12_FULL_50_9]